MMKKLVLALLFVCLLAGCGSDVSNTDSNNFAITDVTESNVQGLEYEETRIDEFSVGYDEYENEQKSTKVMYDIKYEVPESCTNDEEITEESAVYYYGNGMISIHSTQLESGTKPIESYTDEELQIFSESVVNSIEDEYNQFELISSMYFYIGECKGYRVKGSVYEGDELYLDLMTMIFNDRIYLFTMVAPLEERSTYESIFTTFKFGISLDEFHSGNQDDLETSSEPEIEETTILTPDPTLAPSPSYEIYGGDIEVIADYSLPQDVVWSPKRFLIIQNNSDETYDISVSSLAYNEEGNMVSATDGSIEGLGSGCVSIVDLSFDTEEDIYSYDTEINVSVSDFYVSVIQDLSYVQNDIEDGAIFQITNNGEEPTGIVTGYALFFLNDTLVDYEFEWFFDNDTEIKPGRTISEQITTYEEFDRIEFYMTGYRVDF